jgi:hypothetical protein
MEDRGQKLFSALARCVLGEDWRDRLIEGIACHTNSCCVEMVVEVDGKEVVEAAERSEEQAELVGEGLLLVEVG